MGFQAYFVSVIVLVQGLNLLYVGRIEALVNWNYVLEDIILPTSLFECILHEFNIPQH